ncbi:hypothetical protein [Clostridium estertheticum]|uniref:YobI family P-loop NTPase n=1 Tax=Clostridium estertheticum TaxID=238834 RepID=UPI001CF575EF|nr:hypothetical protein [Clostridium estertheticum]MCB2353918.1 hypothetical protein [Clostridium estertheticum]WAG43059.1 hypothetical protein LL065_10415 [Clostridium estertheticum]
MNKIHFEKLTPVNNAELTIYNDALAFVFENNDIRNVAISGPYSAGKSSVIETYKHKHEELKFLHISLANFETTEQESFKIENNSKVSNVNDTESKKNSNTSVAKESILEGKILNQLLHQIDVNKIPQTNFKVKQKVSDKNIILVTFITIIFILSTLHIRFYFKWGQFVNSLSQFKFLDFLKVTTKSISLLFSGLIVISISGVVLYNLIRMQKNKSIFKGFKFKGSEIEIFEKNNESYFDKYLNEVLYIFDNADADVIVFEDIDRYNVNQIFQRLREVNTLINSKRTKENKKILRFFYLLRDDIFISKDRTKFFDFIMPIVPVIDSSNSYDQFISHLKKGGVFEKIEEHFLQRISLYVDDMRILKNIYNEFMVYYNRIGTTGQDHNKLLAMIVYKNIFPRDFSYTQLNRGFISTLFNSKDNFIREEIGRIDLQITELNSKIEMSRKEHLRDIPELNMVYTKTNYYGDYIDTQNPEYIKRNEIICFKKDNKIQTLKNEVIALQSNKMTIRSKKLQQIVTRENIETIFSATYKNFLGEENDFKEIKASQYFDLIKYLIWNGYVDETYEDYMTYFYPNSLTKTDKVFLRSVTDKKAKEWTYVLDNTKLVLSRLSEIDFHEIEILNFSLFTYILNENENKKFLISFIEQLKKEKNFIFMEKYFKVETNLIVYVKSINRYWSSFLEEIFNCSVFSYEQKKEYILLTLYYSDNENMDIVNNNNFLSNTISSDALFLNVKNPKVEKLIFEFLRLNIKFICLDYQKSNKDLFNAVYQNKLYEFTFENISMILKEIYNIKNQNDIKYKNYTLIIADPTSMLSEYVNKNIDQYITLVIDNCESIITDNPEAVLLLINNEDIALVKKSEYVEYLQTQFEFLEYIQEITLWDLFLKKGLIKYSEINILHYYFKSGNGLNEILIFLINSNSLILEFRLDEIDSKYGKGSAESLFDDILICPDLIDDRYKNIIAELGYMYSNFNIKEIPVIKMEILIQLGTIKMTTENVKFMRIAYEPQFIYFIEHNISEYISDVIGKEPISYNELICILDLNIGDSFKTDLISHTNKPILVISKNYSDEVKKYILQNNFDTSELLLLIDGYQNQSDIIKEVIRVLCEEHIDAIIGKNVELSIELFEFLLSKEEILIENKLILLTVQMGKSSKSDCEKYIKVIGSKEHEKIFSGRPKLEITEYNKKLLEKFKKKYWISDFYEENGIYKISRRKLKNNSEIAPL